jgi:DNA-binding response OmpR family regulator
LTKVLIADDQPSLRLLISATLEPEHFDVLVASDGDEAWQLLQDQHPEVALLDVQMPGRTGLDLTRAIRGSEELAATRVILLTSKAQQADVEAGLESGADRYLVKPFSPMDLLDQIEQLLHQT